MKLLKIIKNRKFAIAFIAFLLIFFFVIRPLILSRQAKLESTTVKKGNLSQELTLSGKIDADERITLQFQTGGLLSWVGVSLGDYVQKYQGIASLDQNQLKKTLEKKLNDYMTTRWDFEQTKDNNKNEVLFGQQRYNLETGNKSNFSGQPEVDIVNDMVKRVLEKSQFQLNNSVLDVELQALSIELSNLWTPINGVVTRVDSPFAGINITPNQAQFEIVNPDTIFFDVTADQTEVVDLKEAIVGTIVLDSYPDKTIKGAIKIISFTPKKDETGTVYEIKVAFSNIDNKEYKYKLGMTGDIIFITSEKQNVLYAPLKFIKSDNKGKYVNLGKDGKKVYIQTGFETDNDVEVVKGLKVGDLIYD